MPGVAASSEEMATPFEQETRNYLILAEGVVDKAESRLPGGHRDPLADRGLNRQLREPEPPGLRRSRLRSRPRAFFSTSQTFPTSCFPRPEAVSTVWARDLARRLDAEAAALKERVTKRASWHAAQEFFMVQGRACALPGNGFVTSRQVDVMVMLMVR